MSSFDDLSPENRGNGTPFSDESLEDLEVNYLSELYPEPVSEKMNDTSQAHQLCDSFANLNSDCFDSMASGSFADSFEALNSEMLDNSEVVDSHFAEYRAAFEAYGIVGFEIKHKDDPMRESAGEVTPIFDIDEPK